MDIRFLIFFIFFIVSIIHGFFNLVFQPKDLTPDTLTDPEKSKMLIRKSRISGILFLVIAVFYLVVFFLPF